MPEGNSMPQAILRALASLKLSVTLLALAMVLIYVGTWAQIDAGIYEVQQRYFHSWVARVPIGVILPRTAEGAMLLPGSIIMPGGYAVGLAMLLNLLANWFTRYKFTWSKAGIHLVHLGLVMLLLGEAWTSVTQIDSQLILTEGETRSYTEDPRRYELAVIDRTPADNDLVVAFRAETLLPGATLSVPELPISLRIDEFMINSALLGPMQRTTSSPDPLATQGPGVGVAMVAAPPASGVQNEVDTPSAYVTVLEDGVARGTYLLSMYLALADPQPVKLSDGRELWLQLRPKRYLKPYSITLLDFRHDRYIGTDIPRNYSSRVRLVDPELGIDREELIRMNHPLRHRGETFYQASFSGDDTTVLQVVRNPAVWVPYAACIIGTLGLLVQSGVAMGRGLRRRFEAARSTAPHPAPAIPQQQGTWAIPLVIGTLCIVLLVVVGFRAKVGASDIAQAPVYFDGRLQPIDSVARNSLRAMNGKDSTACPDGQKLDAIDWLLNLICRPETVMSYPVFRIDNPDLLAMLSLDPSRNRFSPNELQDKLQFVTEQVQAAAEVPANRRDVVHRALLQLWNKLMLFSRVSDWQQYYLLPPDDTHAQWRQLSDVLQYAQATGQLPSGLALTITTALTDIREYGISDARTSGAQWISQMRSARPADMSRAGLEVFYNRYQPFICAMALYVLVFLLAATGLLTGHKMPWRSAIAIAIVAFLLHSAAMAVRMYLQGRPPVTNLYSSAIFIGWGTILLALLVEGYYRNGIAICMASLVGIGSLIVAQNLAQGGDTMPSMQAVLDSNFWLTTHVLAITFGYSAAFLAGALGIAFVVSSIAARRWFTPERQASLGRMIYATAIFALVFSFVGTLLGGIWADWSWGRFWGWDPKENGAALIVLWLALMLHARYIGLRERGLAVLAVFANVVTAWSWFGTNMLGVGLHSYGFMDSALMWLLLFVFSQLLIMGLGMIASPQQRTGNGQTLATAAVASR